MTLKKQFPKADGWITAKLTLNPGCTMTEDDATQYINFFSDPANPPEIGHVDVSRNPIVIIYRERKPREESEDRLIREDGSDDDFIKAHGALMEEMLIEEHGTASVPSDH